MPSSLVSRTTEEQLGDRKSFGGGLCISFRQADMPDSFALRKRLAAAAARCRSRAVEAKSQLLLPERRAAWLNRLNSLIFVLFFRLTCILLPNR